MFTETHPTIGPNEISKAIGICIRSGVTPFFHGSPSTAKTSQADAACVEYNLYPIDIRLSQTQPEDLLGFPMIDQARMKACYVPFDNIPLEHDEIPEGYDGWLIKLDEFNACPDQSVEAAAYKLLNERMVGQYKVHPRAAMVAMGNLITDGAIVRESSTAIISRVRHYLVKPDNQAFIKYAYEKLDFAPEIMAYLQFKPAHVYAFEGENGIYSCYRTWEHTNRTFKLLENPAHDPFALATFAGSLGEGIANSFQGFLRYFEHIPDINTIIKDPENAKLSHEPGAQFATAVTLPEHATEENLDKIVRYVNRMPPEIALTSFRELLRINEKFKKHPAVSDWRIRFAQDIAA